MDGDTSTKQQALVDFEAGLGDLKTRERGVLVDLLLSYRFVDGWDQAIASYTIGFECEPLDFCPGISAITLLLQKGTDEARKEADRLAPLVAFAFARQGGVNIPGLLDSGGSGRACHPSTCKSC